MEKHSNWKTYVEYVDIETGEILTPWQFKARKLIKGKLINKEQDNARRTTKYSYGAERDRQGKLW